MLCTEAVARAGKDSNTTRLCACLLYRYDQREARGNDNVEY